MATHPNDPIEDELSLSERIAANVARDAAAAAAARRETSEAEAAANEAEIVELIEKQFNLPAGEVEVFDVVPALFSSKTTTARARLEDEIYKVKVFEAEAGKKSVSINGDVTTPSGLIKLLAFSKALHKNTPESRSEWQQRIARLLQVEPAEVTVSNPRRVYVDFEWRGSHFRATHDLRQIQDKSLRLWRLRGLRKNAAA